MPTTEYECSRTPHIVSYAPDSSEKSLVTLAMYPCAGVGMLTPRSDWSSHKIASLIGKRAKRARHSHFCSIENRGYIIY